MNEQQEQAIALAVQQKMDGLFLQCHINPVRYETAFNTAVQYIAATFQLSEEYVLGLFGKWSEYNDVKYF